MEIDFGSTVECVDGDAGRVSGIVLDRSSMRLVGLVVNTRRIAPEDIVVPMEVVRNVERDRAYLRLTIEELRSEYHRLKESEYVPLGDDWQTPAPDSPEELVVTSVPSVGSQPPLIPALSDLEHPFLLRELTNVPEGAVEIDGETQVLSPDGLVGTLERLFFDATTGRTTHLVTRLHSRPNLLVAVPAYVVDHIDEDAILLKARMDFIDSLPASPEIGE